MKTKKLTRSQERSRDGGDDGKRGGGELHLLVGTKQASDSDDGKQTNERQSRWWRRERRQSALRSSLSVGSEYDGKPLQNSPAMPNR